MRWSSVLPCCSLKNICSVLLMSALLFSTTGCIKEDFPKIEDITKGGKWDLNIGDSQESIYQKLQDLGKEMGFDRIAIVGRSAYDNAADIFESLPFYSWLIMKSTMGREDRVLIGMEDGQVTTLQGGGSMLDSLNHWPDPFTGEAVIRQGDTYEELQVALEAIHVIPQYSTYQFLLPDKPLGLPFDPDMRNYGQWYFTFFHAVDQPGVQGRSQVRLYFEDEKLVRIHHVYDEFEVVN